METVSIFHVPLILEGVSICDFPIDKQSVVFTYWRFFGHIHSRSSPVFRPWKQNPLRTVLDTRRFFEGGFQWIFANPTVNELTNIVSGSQAKILEADHNFKGICVFNFRRHCGYSNISSQLSLSTLSRGDGLGDENYDTNPSSDNPPDGCPHIAPIEKVERISLCLVFLALALYLFYRRACEALIAGRFLRFSGNCLLGFVCFLLAVEFSDSASAFGCGGWESIWRNFLCAYAEHCDNEKGVHGSNTVPQKYPLTTNNYWGTVIGIGGTQMANVLPREKQIAVISALAEGSENFEAAVGLHFAHCNFVKRHNTLRVTPAMEAGIERDFWTVENLLEAAA